MKAWDEIVNKALLGSAKVSLTPADLPLEITEEFDVDASQNNEDTFLKISALAFQFRQSGAKPLKATYETLTEALPESKPYCSAEATTVLKTLLEEEHISLLSFWLRLCQSKEQLAHPETVASLIGIAQRRKDLRNVIMLVAGERGRWLCSLNPDWNFPTANIDLEKGWSEGSSTERRELLQEIRNIDPEKAKKLVESSWPAEGANEKLSFLEILKINISAADLPWLESLKEKSQRVNAVILDLLKMIPSSLVVQDYTQALSASIRLKTDKALLGMINKTEIVFNESFAFPESIFKTGIEKLSSSKNISDTTNIIAQLLMGVPPSFLVDHLQRTPDEIIALLQKDKHSAFYLPAIAISSVRFKDVAWIKKILDQADKNILSNSILTLLYGLEEEDIYQYALKYFDEYPAQIIQLLQTTQNEWPFELAKSILKFTASEVYQYNRAFYRQVVSLIPVSILNHLDTFTPSDVQKQSYWQTQRDELARLLILKQQTTESFNA